jgi:hypothetical protein
VTQNIPLQTLKRIDKAFELGMMHKSRVLTLFSYVGSERYNMVMSYLFSFYNTYVLQRIYKQWKIKQIRLFKKWIHDHDGFFPLSQWDELNKRFVRVPTTLVLLAACGF